MRKAERLFQLVTLMRGRRLAVTAQDLAAHLSVSERTIYRDMQALSLSGVPIEGEAGIGYRIRSGFDIPPLMFTEAELEALVIGARMTQAWTDSDMAAAATTAMQKIAAVLPPSMQHVLEDEVMQVPDFHVNTEVAERLQQIRQAIKQKQLIHLEYRRADQECSQRQIRPLGLFYWGATWTLVAWCELRDDFRQFRLDRILALQILTQHFSPEKGHELEDYLNAICCNEYKETKQ